LLSLDKARSLIFNYPDDSADNKVSERAIRNVKVKQKTYSQFNSFWGAVSFAVLWSITDAEIKNKQNRLNAFLILLRWMY